MDVVPESKGLILEPVEDSNDVSQHILTLIRAEEFENRPVKEVFKRRKGEYYEENNADKSPILFHIKILLETWEVGKRIQICITTFG